MKNVAVIGAGASGLLSAILLKQKYPHIMVDLLDGNVEEGKKILLTGNGRCNLGNDFIHENCYRNHEVAQKVISNFPLEDQRKFFLSLGLRTRMENHLCYPYHFRAKSVKEFLKRKREELGITYIQEKVNDYLYQKDGVTIFLDEKKRTYDFVIFAVGGKSYSHTGSDGKIIDLLMKKGYDIAPLFAGLCPIQVKEKVSSLQGVRSKANAKIVQNGKILYEESGEVLWKKDGLSGIVIMNLSSIIARNHLKDAEIVLDLLDIDETSWLETPFGSDCPLYGVFPKELADYILKVSSIEKKNQYSQKEWKKIYQVSKNLTFHYLSSYGFEDSQVTIGGIEFSCLDEHFISKKENCIGFVGEMLNNDGLCGGYNLMWAFASAKWLVDAL